MSYAISKLLFWLEEDLVWVKICGLHLGFILREIAVK